MGLVTATIVSRQEQDWFDSLLTGTSTLVLIYLPWFGGVGYFTFLCRAARRYDRMQNKLISYRLTEQSIGVKSELVSD